ncbi:unnamed protein product [Calypogeia fissa]
MEAKRSSNALPGNVVDRIIAMMPFPSIFKARLLSKSWLAKFSSASSQDDEVGCDHVSEAGERAEGEQEGRREITLEGSQGQAGGEGEAGGEVVILSKSRREEKERTVGFQLKQPP